MLLPRRSDIKYSRDCIATFLGNPGAKRTTLLPARVFGRAGQSQSNSYRDLESSESWACPSYKLRESLLSGFFKRSHGFIALSLPRGPDRASLGVGGTRGGPLRSAAEQGCRSARGDGVLA